MRLDNPAIVENALEKATYIVGQIVDLLAVAKTAQYSQVRAETVLNEIDSEVAYLDQFLNKEYFSKFGFYQARLLMLLSANDARREKYDDAIKLLRGFIRKAGQKIEQAEAHFYRAEAGLQKALLLDTGRQRTKYLDDAEADFKKSTDRDLLGDLQPYWYSEVPNKLKTVSNARVVEQKINPGTEQPTPATADQFQGAIDRKLPTVGATATTSSGSGGDKLESEINEWAKGLAPNLCAEKAFKRTGTMGGKVTIHIAVSPDGGVKNVSVVPGKPATTLRDETFETCLFDSLRQKKFTPPGEEVDAEFPITVPFSSPR